MPTYDFKCGNCGHLFERLLSISDNSNQKYPVCGKNTQRLISPGAGLIFKGNGFYVNDYRKKGKPEKTSYE
jgi:putative FmdB family regulatory protein